jgi:hypothetical protein
MRRFLRSRVVEWSFAAFMFYWLWAWFVPRDAAFTLIYAVALSLLLSIGVKYAEAVWEAVRDPQKYKLSTRIVLVGMTGLIFSLIGLFAWNYVYQYNDQPPWMRMHIVRNWINWMLMCSIALIWTAVVLIGDTVLLPDGALRRPAIVLGIASLIILVIVYTIGSFH